MKQVLTLLFAFMFALPVAMKAQKTDVDLGVKLGANFTSINNSYWENGYKANLLGGIFLGINPGKLGVQIEGIFSQSTYVAGDTFNTVYKEFYNVGKESVKNGSLRVNYLSIPVLLNIKLFSRAIIQLGPQFSGVVSVQDKDELFRDAKGLFKASWDGVIGVDLKLPAHLDVGARYIIGFSDMNNTDINNTSSKVDDAWKRRTLQLHVGYSIL